MLDCSCTDGSNTSFILNSQPPWQRSAAKQRRRRQRRLRRSARLPRSAASSLSKKLPPGSFFVLWARMRINGIPRGIMRRHMYYVYVLRGPRQLYIGSTKDLSRRIAEHEAGRSKSTKGRGPWKLVYYEASLDEKGTRLREQYLKSAWGRRYLRKRLGYGLSVSHGV